MLKSLTPSEEKLLEAFFNPKCFAETLFTEGSPDGWLTGEPAVKVRLYQIPFLQHDTCLVDDNRLTQQENFDKRKVAGTLWLICGRLIGKTFISLGINILAKGVQNICKQIVVASYDLAHIKLFVDKVCNTFDSHPFFKKFKKNMKRGNPDYEIKLKNQTEILSVNTNVKGKNPGASHWGKHAHYYYEDETQATTDKSDEPRIDAISELGCIDCLCGIPLVTKTSPLGKKLKDRAASKKYLVKLPQYVNKNFTEEKRIERIKQYGGENTVGYKVNVEAILIEGAYGAFEMSEVRDNYAEDKFIKLFEITPETYDDFKNILILDKYKNAEQVLIGVDVGDRANTEIVIVFKINKKYYYAYRITTFKLSLTKQLPELLYWIFNKLEVNYIGIDSTTMGKAVYERMVELLPAKKIGERFINRVIWCSFSETMKTGYEKDEEGNLKVDEKSNEYIEKYEPTLPFCVQKLRDMFFDKLFVIPTDDYAFDEQFSSYLEFISGNRISYDSTTANHIVQAFEVLAKVIWEIENLMDKELENQEDDEAIGFFGLDK